VTRNPIDSRWREWHTQHAAALEALQSIERAYHRLVANHAFASTADLPASVEARRQALQALETARVRLDEIRSKKPSNATQTDL